MSITPEEYATMRDRLAAEIYVQDGKKGACAVEHQSSGPSVGRPAKQKRGMNQWEAEYALILEARKRNHEISWWGFETLRIRLADGAWFKPDFAVLGRYSLEFHEVKGRWREAARVRIKVAAEVIPVPFYVVRRRRGGGFEVSRL